MRRNYLTHERINSNFKENKTVNLFSIFSAADIIRIIQTIKLTQKLTISTNDLKLFHQIHFSLL